jgi:hypothetical protein
MTFMLGLKQQSAIEFVTTYSWAILMISLFIAVVVVLAMSKTSTNYLASTCTIQPSLPCSGTIFTYNSVNPLRFTMLFTNNLGVTMYFPLNDFNLTTTNVGNAGITYNIGNCTPSIATAGTQVICRAAVAGSLKPAVGSQTSAVFTISYQLCSGNSQSKCQSTVYKSTGSSLQTLSPSTINLYTITFQTVPSTASISLNGAVYVNNAVSYFVSQSYNAFAMPPPGYQFISWSATGASTLSSTSLQSTVLTLNANTVLTATYNSVASTTSSTTTTTIVAGGGLGTPSISPSASYSYDFGQSIPFSTVTSGGTPPYTYNWIIVNSVTGTLITSQLYTSCSLTTNAFNWAFASAYAGNTIQANVVVTDSASHIISSAESGTETLNPALSMLTFGAFNTLGYVTISDNTPLDPTQTITVSGWFNVDDMANRWESLIGKGSNAQYQFGQVPLSSELYTSVVTTSGQQWGGDITVPLGTWVHIVMTYSTTTGNLITYYNGAWHDTVAWSGTLTTTGGTMYIGTSGFDGGISNIQIYNTALSPAQIASLYAEGMGGAPIPSAGVVGWWPLNGNANDYSGYGDNGAATSVMYESVLPTNAIIDAGQYQLFQSAWTGGSSSYSANYVISNSVTGAVMASQLYTGITGTTNTFLYKMPAAWVGNSIQANVIVTDGTTTANSIQTGTGILSTPLAMLTVGQFNGAGYISVANNNNLQNTFSAGSFTALGWGNFRNSSVQNGAEIVEKYYPGFLLRGGLGWTQFWLANSVTSNEVSEGGLPALDSWFQIAAVVNSVSSNMILYYNGQYASSAFDNMGNVADSGALDIGYACCSSTNFNGLISDVQVYNTALTSAQIANIYAEGLGGAPATTANLVGWWPLNGNANDYSGQGNNGAVSGVNFVSASATNAPNADAGQYELFQTEWTGGSSAYSVNYIISNSVTGAVMASQLLTGVTGTSSSLLYQIPATWAGNTIQANAIVNDSATATMIVNSVNTAAITVNTMLGTPTLTASNTPIVGPGSYEVFTATIPGGSTGTPPYTYNYIITNTVSGTVVGNQIYTGVSGTSNTFTWLVPAALNGNTIQANVIVNDSASFAATANSVETAAITVYTAPTGPYLYCVAGYYGGGINNVYYAPISSTGAGPFWQSTTNYPITDYWHNCQSYKGYIYCVAGSGGSSQNVYYAPISSTGVGTWSSTATYPLVDYSQGCTITNSVIVCVGGSSGIKNVYYAPVSSTGLGTWSSTTNYKVTVSAFSCVSAFNTIYCVGGANNGAATVYWSPVSSTGVGTWSKSTSYPMSIQSEACVAYSNNIYCVAGYSSSYVNNVYWAPLSSTGVGTWSSTTGYPIAMYKQSCAVYSNTIYGNTIYCVTGNTGSSVQNVYYAPISSTGVGTWSSVVSYPLAEDNGGGQCVATNP